MTAWTAFPHDASDYQYPGDDLEAHWDRLHQGDREPFPDADCLARMDQDYGVLDGANPEDTAVALQEAWRAYHAGDFEQAWTLGRELGLIGSYVANKAGGIHAVYLEDGEKKKMDRFLAIAESSEQAAKAMPGHANSHYFRAFALGRYSQGISITKALKQGLGGKIRASLEAALEIEAEHADAHTAMGLYHAEIIDKIGAMIGGLTYGASADDAVEHFETAMAAAPDSAITRIECANGLMMLQGDDGYERASDLYVEASEMEAADAMERLDIQLALDELE